MKNHDFSSGNECGMKFFKFVTGTFMIHYQLHCGQGHDFDGWFSNSASFESQVEQGLVTCPFCSDRQIERALMAPAIGRKSNQLPNGVPAPIDPPAPVPASAPSVPGSTGFALPTPAIAPQVIEALQHLRSEIEKNCDYVGNDFAEEARKIHYGERDPRGIYGETSLHEAKELLEEGIEIAPLPFLTKDHH